MGGSLGRLLRGLAHRGSTTALLALIAVVAAAAAAAAPAYRDAARISVVSSTFATAPVSAQQLQVKIDGAEGIRAQTLRDAIHSLLVDDTGVARAARVFAPPVVGIEATTQIGDQPGFPVVFRTDVCTHLHLIRGHCPTATGEALTAQTDTVDAPTSAQFATAGLRVVGVYARADPGDPYWFSRYDSLFPAESSSALFVTQSTAERFSRTPTLVVGIGLATTRLTPGDLDAVTRAYIRVVQDQGLAAHNATGFTTIQPTVQLVQQGWSSLDVPTVVATGSLLVLSWLLLFLVVTEDVETRGDQIALARLRGLPRRRVLAAGVAEPLVVLVLAVPVGTLLGWLAAHLLAGHLLGAGIPVGLPALSWVAAVVAVLGGGAAAVAASRRVFARGVLEQWRPTSRSGPRRGWVLDAVLVTAAAAGLVELGVTGAVSSSSSGVQVELMPALLALAVAVVASRLLPSLCRLAATRTRRHGGLAAYLAVRHVARRPGGTRSVMVLAAAVGIALFGVAAWSTGGAARQRVAAVSVGAPTVLTVTPPPDADLGAIVARVDPGGRAAVAVSTYSSVGQTLLAADPARFAAVASWAPGTPVAAVAARLAPRADPPVVVDGDGLRLHLSGRGLDRLLVSATVTGIASRGLASVQLLPTGGGKYAGSLSACPCTLAQLAVSGPRLTPVADTVVLSEVEVHGPAGWRDAGPAAVGSWQPSSAAFSSPSSLRLGPGGLSWTYDAPANGLSVLESSDRPDPLPVVAAGAVAPAGPEEPLVVNGLDGNEATAVPAAVASSVPGAPGTGIVVDRTYALRATGGVDLGQQQVWLAAGAGALVPRLRAAGVAISSSQTTAALTRQLDRQGPGLATALLLFDSAVAAGLAAVGAVVSLVAAARRRRYEYAALVAAGAGRGLLGRSLALEQAIVLGYGLVVGVSAGLAGIALTLPRVPVLITTPVAPVLDLAPRAGPLTAAVGIALLAVVLAAAISAAALVRTVRPAALREGMA